MSRHLQGCERGTLPAAGRAQASPRAALRGMALVAVLWMTAALSLLVAGMLSTSRTEVRAAQVRSAIGEATALGDAAIQLAVLEWRTATPPPNRLVHTTHVLDGRSIEVRVVPASGYINLNTAPETLLRALLAFSSGFDATAANTLAQRIIDWRDPDDAAQPDGAEAPAYLAAGSAFRPRNGNFVVPEDLLQVLGVDPERYEQIRPLITVWSSGGGQGVNPYAAPPEVLAILAGGDLAKASRFAAARDAGDQTIDLTRLEQAHLANGQVGNILHIEAVVPVDDNRRALRGRWIVLAVGEDGSPWRTILAEPARLLPAEPKS